MCITKPKLDYCQVSSLESHVAEWLIEQAENYEDGLKSVFTDLFYGGCQSGFVSHLIYSADCRKFICEHMTEIEDVIIEMTENLGAEPLGAILFKSHFSFDHLAWLVFEETARSIGIRSGFDI